MLPREFRKLHAIALREPTIMPMLPDRLQVSAPAWTYCACAPDGAMRAPDRTTAEASVRIVMAGFSLCAGSALRRTVAQPWCRRPAGTGAAKSPALARSAGLLVGRREAGVPPGRQSQTVRRRTSQPQPGTHT